MAKLPPPISRTERAELSLTDDGKKELAALEAERRAILDKEWPEPELGDILELKQRLESDSSRWRSYVADVRRNRFAQDRTPEKYRVKLNIPDDRRFRTNLTANEVNRVSAMMGRNAPRVTIPPAGTTDKAVQRGEKQSRWAKELLVKLERNTGGPLWAKGDDGACENGQGFLEWYMADRWKAVEKLIDERDGEVDDADLDKQIDEALKTAGLNFAVRYVDSLSGYVDLDEDGTAYGLVVERKKYAQVYARAKRKMSTDAFAEAQLPPVSARAWPDSAFAVAYGYLGNERMYDGRPDDNGDVEVIRYYDRRWLVEVVAGKVVECSEHNLPGVPLFRQLGKVTSNSSTEFMIQGVVNAAMLTQELALNDAFTISLDNLYTYGRPFPVIETNAEGAALLGPDGMPQNIDLSNPERPPQLGPGQHVADAFGAFRGHVDPGLLQAIHSYWQMSGLNPISQGDSPGSDPSGYAINTLQTSGQALYESILDNKCQTFADIVDFSRMAVRDTIQEVVYLSVEAAQGETGIEYLGLGPDDIDEAPATIKIDPKSDTQQMAQTEYLLTGMQAGLVSRRTVQRNGFGGVIADADDEDKEILRDQIRQGLVPFMAQFIVQTIAQDAFPSAAPGGAPPPPGAAPQPNMPGQPQAPSGPSVGPMQSPPQAVGGPPQGIQNGRPGMPSQNGGVPLVG